MFEITQCSPMFAFEDPIGQINKILIFFVIAFEIILVLLLRLCSILKNHDLQAIFKEIIQKDKKSEETQQTEVIIVEDLDAESQTQIKLPAQKLNSFSDKNKTLNVESIENPLQLFTFSEEHNKTTESASTQQNSNEKELSERDKEQIEEDEQKYFINFFRLKLTLKEASFQININLGLTYLSLWATSIHFPFSMSMFAAIAHLVIFCVAVSYNIFKKPLKKSKQTCQANIEDNQVGEQPSRMERVEDQESKKEKGDETSLRNSQKEEKSSRFNTFLAVLVAVLNIYLLNLSLLGLKQSYFNTVSLSC